MKIWDALEQLVDIQERVRELAPSHRDPEKFHHGKDLIDRKLGRLIREIELGPPRESDCTNGSAPVQRKRPPKVIHFAGGKPVP